MAHLLILTVCRIDLQLIDEKLGIQKFGEVLAFTQVRGVLPWGGKQTFSFKCGHKMKNSGVFAERLNLLVVSCE